MQPLAGLPPVFLLPGGLVALPPALPRWMPADSWGYFGPVGSVEGTARGALTPDSGKEFPGERGKPQSRGLR